MKNWWADKEDFLLEYIAAQTRLNETKFKNVWVSEKEIRKICRYIKKHLDGLSFGLCHGSRNGKEICWFRKLLKINVVGTDISETAKDIKNMVVWDFNVENEEWVGVCDFVYSNSLDHTYDLERCLSVWERQLKDDGLCFVHMGNESHLEEYRDAKHYAPGDCLSATKEEYERAFRKVFFIGDYFETAKDRFVYVLGKRFTALERV